LIWGPPGTGKTTLASTLASRLASAGVRCLGIAADPGSPGFGIPGAIALGRWAQSDWHVERLAPLCTLDAVRYRLPLVLALRRLAVQASRLPLLVDAPVEAQVKRLVPFHFSRRYESEPDIIYAEVKAAIGSAHIAIRPGGFGT